MMAESIQYEYEYDAYNDVYTKTNQRLHYFDFARDNLSFSIWK